MPSNSVQAISIDAQGNKWIGTGGEGLAKFDGLNWTVYNTNTSGLPNDYVCAIAIDALTNKWIGTDKGLAVYREGGVILGFMPDHGDLLKDFALYPNYPNPFNPTTTIRFWLPMQVNVTLKVFDLLGREVKTLIASELNPGEHTVLLELKDWPSGVYFYRLQAGAFVDTKKLLLLR